jgi:IS30 family transposase
MKGYKQLSLLERETIFGWRKEKISFREIGRRLGRPHTTLTREFLRNAKYGAAYIPCIAQNKADKRATKQRSQASWKGPEIYLYIREHLKEKQYLWSPEQIAGRISLEHPELHICHETIYQAIYAKENKKDKLWQYLTVKRQKRMKKGGRHVQKDSHIPEAVSIDRRPKSVNKRKQVGHWETDNVIGKQTDKTALSVTVERKIRLTIMSKLTAKTADEKTKKLFERLSVFPDRIRKTMTADNGAENTNHKQISESLTMDVYFCHAYHSWERGTVENTNGRIRKFIPKGMSMDQITEKEIAAIEVRLNNTPRKCLGYMTPYEKLQEYLKGVY